MDAYESLDEYIVTFLKPCDNRSKDKRYRLLSFIAMELLLHFHLIYTKY